MKYPEPNKVIYGKIQPYLEIKKEEEAIDIPKVREFISEEEKTEKTVEYMLEHKEFIKNFIDMLMTKSFNEWNLVMSKNNDKEMLDDYIVKHYVFHRKKLQDFTAFIQFENSIKNTINKEQKSLKKQKKSNKEIKQFLNGNFSYKQWFDVLKKWIKEGFKNKVISDYMMNYQLE